MGNYLKTKIITPKYENDGHCFNYNSIDGFDQLVQDNFVHTAKKGTIRAFGMQIGEYSQTKIIQCINGKIVDVSINLNKHSRNYLECFTHILSAQDRQLLVVPKGFAHGYMTLEDNTEITYAVDRPYSPKHEFNFRYDSLPFSIPWKEYLNVDFIISKKDLEAKEFKNI